MSEQQKRYLSGIIIGDVKNKNTSLREELGKPGPADNTQTGPFELIEHEMVIERKKVDISLWTIDSSSDNWKTIRGTYYKHASGAIIVFDSTEEYWIEELKFWVKEIKKENSKITMVLVHNLIGKKEMDSIDIEELIANKVFKRYKYKFSIVKLCSITEEKVEEIYKLLVK